MMERANHSSLPITVVGFSAGLLSVLCITSASMCTEAPRSSTPAFSEAGTRTHTWPEGDKG